MVDSVQVRIGGVALWTNKAEFNKVVSLSKKAAANRRNAQLSTGPRTAEGKSWSRRNALKHRILASALLFDGADDLAEFNELISALTLDLAPVGKLEELFVEKIAVCLWRQRLAQRCERGLARQQVTGSSNFSRKDIDEQVLQAIQEGEEIFRRHGLLLLPSDRRERLGPPNDIEPKDIEMGSEEGLEEIDNHRESMKDSRSLPLGAELDRILRYETANQRQLAYAINQLERMQRARKGEQIPAPVSVQVSSDQ